MRQIYQLSSFDAGHPIMAYYLITANKQGHSLSGLKNKMQQWFPEGILL